MYFVIKIKVDQANFMKFLKNNSTWCVKCDEQKYWSFDLKTYFEKIYGNLICILKYVK